MPFLLDHGLYALRKADDIGIKSFQDRLVLLVRHPDNVDGSDGPSLWRDGVEEGDDLLLIGDGDVQPSQFGILVEHLRQFVDAWNLEVLILGVDTFISKLLVEVADGK